MINRQIKIFKFLSFIIIFLSSILLIFLFFQNSHSIPLILHYAYDFGDFVGNKISLIYIIFGIWSIFLLNFYLSKIIQINFKSLSNLLITANFIISLFSLILSLQIFLNNI